MSHPTKRPDVWEERAAAKGGRTLPVHCDDCRAVDVEINERIDLSRRMEDAAAAFAMVGLLCFLRQTHGRVVDEDPYEPGRIVDLVLGEPIRYREPATRGEIEWALHYLDVAMRKIHNEFGRRD